MPTPASNSLADVQTAINAASAGDTIIIPSGEVDWGASGAYLTVDKAIFLTGANAVTISSTSDAPSGGLIRISADAKVGNFIINPCSQNARTIFTTSSATSAWRITGVTVPTNSVSYYFLYTESTAGLVDNCDIFGGSGTAELILARGPADAWQNNNTLGGASNVFVEDCTFRGEGYVCDANANARMVVRFCTIAGKIKIDAHGLASNSPARSCRNVEAYNNTWTDVSGFWWAMLFRGGTGMVFNNNSVNGTSSQVEMEIEEFGCVNTWPNFGNKYQTLAGYPIGDQIGCGKDVILNATSLVAFRMYRIKDPGDTNFIAIGSSSNDANTQFIATGAGTGTGTVYYSPGGAEPYYLWNNTKAGSAWALNWTAIPAGANTQYSTDIGVPGSTFTMQQVIAANRDYFFHNASFDGSSGVGVGTKSQMDAITPVTTGVGFWVTDEGSWDTTKVINTSGQLYVWNGDSWEWRYTPYQYPHPAAGILEAPSDLTATAVSASAIHLAWTINATDATSQNIRISADGVNFTALETISSNAKSYFSTGLASDTAYWFDICASTDDVDSAYCAPASATTLAAPAPTAGYVSSGNAAGF